jgi:hypothetical protein
MTPPSEKETCAGEAWPFGSHAFDRSNHPPQTTNGQEVAMQIAQLSLAGYFVRKGAFADFIVCKYGPTRYCSCAAVLLAFTSALGVTE